MKIGFWIFLVVVLVWSNLSFAQCVGEIKEVKQDVERGSIIVETEYKLNNVVVLAAGRSRYLETTGDLADIIAKAKLDIKEHCAALVKRIDKNATFINTEKLKQQKALTQPLITNMQSLVGHKETINEVITSYKGKDIKVTHDEKTTVTDTPTP